MDLLKFLENVASDSPTPGGGSVSALAGALSASLLAMVAGLSLKKEREKQKEMREVRKKALALQRKLFFAIEADAKSFEAVMKAFRLPKTTERERANRIRAIQKAYQKATVIPQTVCEQSIRLLEHSRFLIQNGNPNAISDTGVAAFLADAALAGGLLNIGINLVPVTDQAFLKRMRSRMQDWTKQRNHLMGEVIRSLTTIG